jgi:hypothetical protein
MYRTFVLSIVTKKVLVGFGDFAIRIQVNRTVKHADELALLTKEGTVLQGITDRLIEIWI